MTDKTLEEQAELDALLLAEQERREAFERERIAREAHLIELRTRIIALGDIAEILDRYIDKSLIQEDEGYNLAGFEAEHIEDASCGFFRYSQISKPTLEQLEALKDSASEFKSQQVINKESLEYLDSTDYLIIREMDNGTPCPSEVRALRQQARERIVR